MNYQLLKEVISLIEVFEDESTSYTKDLNGLRKWMAHDEKATTASTIEPYWEGKENGRSPESAINTLLVHMNRYAKTYARAAISGSDFSTQEDFIYLINLKAFGPMTKMELVNKNIQDKPTGMQIINRLVGRGWAIQGNSTSDKRSKVISITEKGSQALEAQMDNIRQASRIVTGNLSHGEKMELIRLLNKLNDFHQPIFLQHIDSKDLLATVSQNYLPTLNSTA